MIRFDYSKCLSNYKKYYDLVRNDKATGKRTFFVSWDGYVDDNGKFEMPEMFKDGEIDPDKICCSDISEFMTDGYKYLDNVDYDGVMETLLGELGIELSDKPIEGKYTISIKNLLYENDYDVYDEDKVRKTMMDVVNGEGTRLYKNDDDPLWETINDRMDELVDAFNEMRQHMFMYGTEVEIEEFLNYAVGYNDDDYRRFNIIDNIESLIINLPGIEQLTDVVEVVDYGTDELMYYLTNSMSVRVDPDKLSYDYGFEYSGCYKAELDYFDDFQYYYDTENLSDFFVADRLYKVLGGEGSHNTFDVKNDGGYQMNDTNGDEYELTKYGFIIDNIEDYE